MTTPRAESVRKSSGLFANVPRSLRTEVVRRLRALEQEPARFDRAALEHRAQLKRLYALLHIKPGPDAQALLFERPPEGSAAAALRALASGVSPSVAAELVRRHRIPFLLVESAFGALPPQVALALVETLDDGEFLKRLQLLARRVPLTGQVRDAVLARLRAMGRATTVTLSYRKAESIARLSGLDRELAEALYALVRSRVTAALEGDTALLVDGSASVARDGAHPALASRVGPLVDAALAPAARRPLVLFGAEALAVQLPRGADPGRWRAALAVPAEVLGTGSSVGAAVDLLARVADPVRRLVVVTDGYENRAPRLPGALERYRATTGVLPAVCLVQPADGARQLAVDLRSACVPFEVFTADASFAGLDALVPTLAGASRTADLYTEIAGYPLAGQ